MAEMSAGQAALLCIEGFMAVDRNSWKRASRFFDANMISEPCILDNDDEGTDSLQNADILLPCLTLCINVCASW